jgi:hypothetical protein
MHSQIVRRLKKLQVDINGVNLCYEETLRDAYADCGMEYNKSVPYNEENIKKNNEMERNGKELEEQRAEKLYDQIFNFSQTFFSIKDYLKNIHPQHSAIIEDFFSNEKRGGIARKDISNDLKHNPQNDLVYDRHEAEITLHYKMIDAERIVPIGKTISFETQKKWHYKGIYSVEYCNLLYSELLAFIGTNKF